MENIKIGGSGAVNLNIPAGKDVVSEAGETSGVTEASVAEPKSTPDFKLEINDLLRQKLSEASKTVQERMNMLKSLPPEIGKAVSEILLQNAGRGEMLGSGLAEVLRRQKITVDTLNDFAEVLLTAAKLAESGEEGNVAADKLLAQFTALRQAVKTEIIKNDALPDFFSALEDDSPQVDKGLTAMIADDEVNGEEVLQAPKDSLIKQKVLESLRIELPQRIDKSALSSESAGANPSVKGDSGGALVQEGQEEASQVKAVTPQRMQQEMSQEKLGVSAKGKAETPFRTATEQVSGQMQEKSVVAKNEAFLLTPRSLAGELLQLARNETDSSRGAQLQRLVDVFQKNVLQETHPYAGKVAEALASFEPGEVSFIAARHEIPALKEAWIKLAAEEVLPLVDLSAEEMEFAKLVLREVEKTVSQSNIKTAAPETAGKLTALLEQLPAEVTEKLVAGLQQGQVPERIARIETALGFAKTFKEAPVLASEGKQINLPKLKQILTSMVGQDKAMELSEFVKLVKQVALREVAGEQLKEGLAYIESRLGLKEMEKNPAWNGLQKNEEMNKSGQNAPDSLLKANNPLLAKVVLLLRATEAAEWRGHSAAELRHAAAAIKETAAVMQKQDAVIGERQSEHSVLSFSTALQMAPGVIYPAHIHIYHQHAKEKGRDNGQDYETWVRVSLETENIGDVRAVFRIYENDRLDVRVGFKQAEALQQFRRQLPELRMSLEGERLKLRDLGGNKI